MNNTGIIITEEMKIRAEEEAKKEIHMFNIILKFFI